MQEFIDLTQLYIYIYISDNIVVLRQYTLAYCLPLVNQYNEDDSH